jgi:hypothetical protein
MAELRPFYFCFTLDTEPDNLWIDGPVPAFTHFERLFDFHRELTMSGARPTYLTTSEVAEHPDAARVMQRIMASGEAELGAHFHSWTRSWPFPVPDLGDPPAHACVHQLGQDIEERMLEHTCSSLARYLGVRPVSYRGGRWSLNEESPRSLRNCGIIVDSTVTPGLSWADASNSSTCGPDFRHSPRHPYWLAEDLLELPVGASFHPNRNTAVDQGPKARLMRLLRRTVGRPSGVLWLRPTTMSRSQMRACLEQLRQDQVPVWVAMIHSSEIGLNSYFQTEDQVARFRSRCIELVEDALSLGAVAATLTDARASVLQGEVG